MTLYRFIALLTLSLFPVPLFADTVARDLILGAGGEIDFGKSVPGKIDLTGEGAFPLLQDANGTIIAACSETGKARAVGFAHGSFLKPGKMTEQEAVVNLVANAVRWAGRSSAPEVGLHPKLSGLQPLLESHGCKVQVFPPEEMRDYHFNVYCVIGHEDLSDGDIVKLFEFLNDGGGLVTATTPWAFGKKYERFSEFPANQVLSSVGMQFLPDGSARNAKLVLSSKAGTTMRAEKPEPGTTWPMAVKDSRGDRSGGAGKALARLMEKRDSLSATEVAELVDEIKTAQSLPADALAPLLLDLKKLNEEVGPIVPTQEAPVVPGQKPVVDAVIELETFFNENADAGAMYAIPASSDYPGEVPEDAERVTHTIEIDGIYKGWLEGRNAGGWAAKEMRPIGIYAPPGEVIAVTLPARLVGEGFEVVVGSYGGNLKNRDQWHRYPDWQVSRPVQDRVTRISSGLGGLVTIRVPRGAEYEKIEVTLEGGVRAPLYEYGKTSLDDWNREIRKYPAPWAELASDRMIVAIPSEYIRTLSNPDEVMEVWNGFIDTAAELVMVDRNDYRAERIVFDRQTSAGAMHSSYPVAAHLGSNATQAVDARLLKTEGNWGFFHEYGHNHQHNLWALPGTGETTCNLWSVYLFEEFVGKNRDNTHRAIRPLDRKQRMNAYFNGGSFESDWSMWTALEAYLEVQEEFGWEPFKKVFDEYNHLEPDDRPKGQQEINDQWVIRLSKACGKNLEPFWSAWKLPLSPGVAKELKELPVWEDSPVTRYGAGS